MGPECGFICEHALKKLTADQLIIDFPCFFPMVFLDGHVGDWFRAVLHQPAACCHCRMKRQLMNTKKDSVSRPKTRCDCK